MSMPGDEIIDLSDINDIISGIENIRPVKINNINIEVFFSEHVENFIKNIFLEEILAKLNMIIHNFNSSSTSLDEQESFYKNQILNNLFDQLENSPIVALLRPISIKIYNNACDICRNDNSLTKQKVNKKLLKIEKVKLIQAEKEKNEQYEITHFLVLIPFIFLSFSIL